MVTVSPTRIAGRWREGYALDFHTQSSTYIGDDEFGHPRFDTTRTELGELLYRLKYSRDKAVIPEIVETTGRFCRKWKAGFEVLVPIPPTRKRQEQPVVLLAKPLAEALNVEYGADLVKKTREIPELKDVHDFSRRIELLEGAFSIDKAATEGRSILLFDDLFRSGATLNAVAGMLYDEGKAAEVYALTLTRTRRAQ
jgi:predicted amidophosphoribosyltransferase